MKEIALFHLKPNDGTVLLLSPCCLPAASAPQVLSAGRLQTKVKVITCPEVPTNYISVPAEILQQLCLPTDVSYQVIHDHQGLQLGPVLGLLAAKKRSLLALDLESHLPYCASYGETGGLVCVFSADSVNYSDMTIDGYYYREVDDGHGQLVAARLPFPSVVYRRVSGLSRSALRRLREASQGAFFNSWHFNKEQFWQIARSSPFRTSVPETMKISSLNDIRDFLKTHGSLYLKPVNGTMAQGLLKMWKSGSAVCWQGAEEEKPHVSTSLDAAIHQAGDLISGKEYLLQNAIKPLKLQGRRCCDLRVVMQKNEQLKWRCTGVMARVGRPRGISSNFTEQGYALTLEQFLRKAKVPRAKMIKRRLTNLCTEVCLHLDTLGEHFADLGFDLIIDVSYKIWLLEINKRHNHSIFSYHPDQGLRRRVQLTPMRYMTRLAGFDLRHGRP